MRPTPQLVLNASSRAILEMDQVSAKLSKQDLRHHAKPIRGKMTRRQSSMGMTAAVPLN
jgi:hypothetical protein